MAKTSIGEYGVGMIWLDGHNFGSGLGKEIVSCTLLGFAFNFLFLFLFIFIPLCEFIILFYC